jgi:hypothetical protein
MIPASMKLPPAASIASRMRTTVSGATALQSANAGLCPDSTMRAATSRASSSAAAGGMIERTSSASERTVSSVFRSSMPARSARRRVASLRPVSVVTAR